MKSLEQIGTELAAHNEAKRSISDLTARLIANSSYGPGELTRVVAKAKAAQELTPTLAATLDNLRRRSDRTMGFTSKALAYSHAMRQNGKREHANMIRLLKGGYVFVTEEWGRPPQGTVAYRDSPYGEKFYTLHIAGEQ